MAMNASQLSMAIQKSLTTVVTSTFYDSKGNARQVTSKLVPPITTTNAIAENVVSHIQQYGEVHTNVDTNVNTQVQGQALPGIPLVAGAFPGATTGPGVVQGSGVGTGKGHGVGKVS